MSQPELNNNWLRQQVTTTALRRNLSHIVRRIVENNEVVVVTVDSCPCLAMLDLRQFEELCYQVADHQ